MLRTITELVPYGQDAWSKNISAMYIANIGENSDGTCNYLVGYFEAPSDFCKGIEKYKVLTHHNRRNSTFEALNAIYGIKYDWLSSDDLLEVYEEKQSDVSYIVQIFKERASKDLKYKF